jgi:hypothetical protein
LELARHYRFGYRAIARSTDERTFIATLMPPPTVSTRKVASDITAFDHPTSASLVGIAMLNTFVMDYVLRPLVQTDVSLFIVKRLPIPEIDEQASKFLAHSTLRLVSNHAGFLSLWQEQVGKEWREEGPKHRWPCIADEGSRWLVRAAIDALLCGAFALSRDDYEHILGSFSHKSFPDAPKLCLAAFDELKKIGLKAFLKKHDPYWDIPLNHELPKPVIDLAIPEPKASKGQGLLPGMGAAVESRRRPRKRT